MYATAILLTNFLSPSQMLNILDKIGLTLGRNHENISPTWTASVELSEFRVPAIATPYYSNGNILEYVCRHPSANKFNLVCQTVSALAYIHSKGVVHGNVCPVSLPPFALRLPAFVSMLTILTFQNNVCIADDGSVRVTDIGVDELVRQTHAGNHLHIPSTWMYKPPEELESGARTMQTDVYSLAVTIHSVCLYLNRADECCC